MGDANTILVVDDNALILELMRQLLEADYEVVDARNGEQAIEAAREHSPDLILMDLMMPVLDGWSAIERIRAEWKVCRIPIIAVTAVTDLRGTRRARDLGADAVIEKPIDERELLGLIERLIGAASLE